MEGHESIHYLNQSLRILRLPPSREGRDARGSIHCQCQSLSPCPVNLHKRMGSNVSAVVDVPESTPYRNKIQRLPVLTNGKPSELRRLCLMLPTLRSNGSYSWRLHPKDRSLRSLRSNIKASGSPFRHQSQALAVVGLQGKEERTWVTQLSSERAEMMRLKKLPELRMQPSLHHR